MWLKHTRIECFLLIHREDFGFIVNVVWINAITPQQALQWETEIKKAKVSLVSQP